MGPGPDAGIGGEQVGQIEAVDRLVDSAGEMVGGQVVVNGQPFGRLAIPRGYGEAIEVGIVPRWERDENRGEVDPGSGRVGPTMVSQIGGGVS